MMNTDEERHEKRQLCADLLELTAHLKHEARSTYFPRSPALRRIAADAAQVSSLVESLAKLYLSVLELELPTLFIVPIEGELDSTHVMVKRAPLVFKGEDLVQLRTMLRALEDSERLMHDANMARRMNFGRSIFEDVDL